MQRAQLIALDLATCNRRDLCDAPAHFFFERIGSRNLMLWAVTRTRLRAWCLVDGGCAAYPPPARPATIGSQRSIR